MQPADAAVSRRMNISWYATKWRRHALTQISLRQMRGQFTSQITGEERFDEKEEDTESKPDIVYVDKTTNSISIIDITIPLDDNINTAYSNKIAKYEDLRRQFKNIYNTNNVFIFPIVITTNGLVHKNTLSNLEKLKIKNARNVVKKCQKSVIISTTGIIRRVLAEEE
ncbi:hypothetical protein M8J77_006971 [Diaphorina citri]|nr:hypothetical protein M8J77_006971 [Diaphorina citri]